MLDSFSLCIYNYQINYQTVSTMSNRSDTNEFAAGFFHVMCVGLAIMVIIFVTTAHMRGKQMGAYLNFIDSSTACNTALMHPTGGDMSSITRTCESAIDLVGKIVPKHLPDDMALAFNLRVREMHTLTIPTFNVAKSVGFPVRNYITAIEVVTNAQLQCVSNIAAFRNKMSSEEVTKASCESFMRSRLNFMQTTDSSILSAAALTKIESWKGNDQYITQFYHDVK